MTFSWRIMFNSLHWCTSKTINMISNVGQIAEGHHRLWDYTTSQVVLSQQLFIETLLVDNRLGI